MELSHKEQWEALLENTQKMLRCGRIESAIGSLRKAAEKLSDDLERKHRIDCDYEEVRVVHYTSLETTHALLTESSTQHLRLYDSVHLTDPQEGADVFSGRSFFQSKRISQWLESPVSHAYIISFLPYDTKHKTHDHLSHWRAYGDNGRGCSLVTSAPKGCLYAVNYDSYAKDNAANKLKLFVDVAADLWDRIIKESKSSRLKYESFLEYTFATALKSRFLHKHPSYRHERERRALVVTPKPGEIETEARGRHIRHYVRNDAFCMDRLLNSDCRITVGPAVDHQGDVAETLKRILDRNGKTGPRIQVSEIPYRTY